MACVRGLCVRVWGMPAWEGPGRKNEAQHSFWFLSFIGKFAPILHQNRHTYTYQYHAQICGIHTQYIRIVEIVHFEGFVNSSANLLIIQAISHHTTCIIHTIYIYYFSQTLIPQTHTTRPHNTPKFQTKTNTTAAE